MAGGSADSVDVNAVVRFLLARLDDEAVELKKLLRAHAQDPDIGRAVERCRAHLEAKRQVIGVLQKQLALRDLPLEKPVRGQAIQMLRALAKPHADHRGYRREWT